MIQKKTHQRGGRKKEVRRAGSWCPRSGNWIFIVVFCFKLFLVLSGCHIE